MTSPNPARATGDVRALLAIRRFIGLRGTELVLPIAAGALTLLSALTLTVVSAWLITKSWQMPPVLDLTVAVTAVRALGISRALFRYLDRLASHDLALRCAERARVAAYRALALGSPARTVRLSRGALLTRVGADVDMVADVIVRAVVPTGVSVLVSATAVFFTALLSPAAAAVLAVGLLVAGVAAPWATARATRIAEERRGAAVEAHVTAVDRVLSDAPALRIRGDLDPALAAADRAARDLAGADEAGAPADAAGSAITTLASGFTVLFVVLTAMVGYVDVVGGGIGSVGAADAVDILTNVHSPQWLGVLALLPLAAFEGVAALPGAAVAVTRAAGAARRLGEFTGGAVEAGEAASESIGERPHLRAHGLVTGFDRDLGVWDLDLPFGARETIVAPSGSGKTTLLLTLAGLLPRRGGTVTLEDAGGTGHESGHESGLRAGPVDIDDLPPGIMRGTVTFVAEDDHIFATSVLENLAVGAPDATDAEIAAVIDAVGLGDWVAALPRGADTVLDAGADDISGGQRRRLLLARALLTDSPILLLDEPAEHLDDEGADALLELLTGGGPLPGARAERTVVVVRHPRTRHGR